LIGFYAKYKVLDKLDFKTSVSYSVKSSNSTSPTLKHENQYLDFNFSPQFEIVKNFYLQLGVSYSNLLASNIIINNGDRWNGVERVKCSGFDSEANVFAGIEFKVRNNINGGVNYVFPTSDKSFENIRFTLNFLLNNREPKKVSYKQIKQIKSEEQIHELKNGTLLVRLKTSVNKINALKEMGHFEKADKVKEEQKIENKKIVAAFNKSFNFCDIVFFYSDKSKNVMDRDFDNVFLNENLEIDKKIKIDTDKEFFIAEFSGIEQDTTKHFSHYSYKQDEKGEFRKIPNYYSPSTEIDFYALVIRDNNSIQLNKPFPYYVRAMFLSIKECPEQALFLAPILPLQVKTYEDVIIIMNQKLWEYHSKN
ncbi:MAG: hypothetical protein U9R32_02630, partial [Bacteroidota bacterium]|nr:hypothetical protein [Bacteroidota bacterium]